MSQQWKNSEDGGDDVQVPLGTGGGAEAPTEEYSAPRGPRINTSTIALVAAFAAGLVVLYFLGLGNKPRAASADRIQQDHIVSDNISKLLGDRGQQKSVDEFLRDSQLLLDRLGKYFSGTLTVQNLSVNPFEHEMAHVEEPITSAFQTTPVIPQDQTKAIKIREAAVYFASLKLQMVMLGNPSMAMINSRMVTVGNQLEMFTVTEIKNDSVIMTFEDTPYVLKSSSPTMNKP